MIKKYLIVGLQNPGERYQTTRHNAGAMFIEAIAAEERTRLMPHKRCVGFASQYACGTSVVHIFLPDRFMNDNGISVQAYLQYYDIPLSGLIVAHDELDFPVGTLRLKQGGGHGGHNGLRSVIASVGSDDFRRIRIGIGRPQRSADTKRYVLAPMHEPERKLLHQSIQFGLQHFHHLLRDENEFFMNKVHQQGDQHGL